ncbi:PLP-dependent aminotransferase family protein [Paraburkholderia sp. BCC1884]|uniref:aminotransferase-like domain-containing protein n=1 Tax=Paraburkholderia sp. BCC1884 TaxID=2562668 RepID=UPI001182FB53|nr:PLP-dependent aminotransferase family protein [Paraburkholderia sp. BCC1884]
MNSTPTARYVWLANRLHSEIRKGLWVPGQRLLSVRQLGLAYSVSVTTALAAYRRLEDLQIIESRPKRGYFVRASMGGKAPRENNRAEVGQDDPQDSHASQNRQEHSPSTSFGAAVCCDSLFPTNALARHISTAVRHDNGILSRPSSTLGSASLRLALAAHAATWNCHVDDNSILVTNGCVEALSLALRALTSPGDTVLVDSPTYFGYLSTIAQLQLIPLAIPFLSAPLEALNMVINLARNGKIAACILAPTVSNPSGTSMSEDGKQRLVDLLDTLSIPLIEDATFNDLHFNSTQRAAKSYDRTGNVVLCSSTSKTLMPGTRLGWVAGGRYHQSIVSIKGNTSATPPLVVQRALGDFLQGGGYQHHLRRFRRRAKAQVLETLAYIQEQFPSGTSARLPDGGYLLWVRLPDSRSATELAMCASSEGIRIAPGPMFSPMGKFRDYVRINCGFQLDAPRRAVLRRIADIATALVHPTELSDLDIDIEK